MGVKPPRMILGVGFLGFFVGFHPSGPLPNFPPQHQRAAGPGAGGRPRPRGHRAAPGRDGVSGEGAFGGGFWGRDPPPLKAGLSPQRGRAPPAVFWGAGGGGERGEDREPGGQRRPLRGHGETPPPRPKTEPTPPSPGPQNGEGAVGPPGGLGLAEPRPIPCALGGGIWGRGEMGGWVWGSWWGGVLGWGCT